MTKTDKIIFWSVLALSLISFVFLNVFPQKNGEKTVVIEVDGRHYAEYKMSEIEGEIELNVMTDSGSNRVLLSKESVKITEADCKDALCIGEISKAGEILVCLPHKVMVKITGNGEADKIAY